MKKHYLFLFFLAFFLINIPPSVNVSQSEPSYNNLEQIGRCQAITKKGTQCKRNAQAGSSYCWQHQSLESNRSVPSNKSGGKKTELNDTDLKSKSKSSEVRSIQCQATTKKGKQCSRRAKAGSNYCWQHAR